MQNNLNTGMQKYKKSKKFNIFRKERLFKESFIIIFFLSGREKCIYALTGKSLFETKTGVLL